MISWLKNNILQVKSHHRTVAVITAAVFAVIWVALFYLCGLFTGYAATYSAVLSGVLSALSALAVLILREFARSALLSLAAKVKVKRLLTILITIALSLPAIHFSAYSTWNAETVIRMILFELLPALATSALYTSLCSVGGLIPALLYGFTTLCLPRLIPVLPGSVVLTGLAVEFILPVFFILAVEIIFAEEKRKHVRKERSVRRTLLAVAVPVLLFAVIALFFAGILPLRPTVIATGSMRPDISVGDIAIIAPCDADDLQIGDVIQYRYQDASVVHRIVRKSGSDYITQGDANNAEDIAPVSPEQVEGRLLTVVPGVGTISMWIHSDEVVYDLPSLWG